MHIEHSTSRLIDLPVWSVKIAQADILKKYEAHPNLYYIESRITTTWAAAQHRMVSVPRLWSPSVILGDFIRQRW